MSRRKVNDHTFQNNKRMGAYADIHFEITGDTALGKEGIQFDTKIHYFEKGKGEPLLLVHGIGQSLYTWRNNIDFFANNGFRVVAMDLAGFGYSRHPHIYYTVEEYALIIKAFLDAIKIKKAHIAAFSTSCLSAICFASANPARVGKMIFVSPGGPNEYYPFALKILTTWIGQTFFRFFANELSIYNILSRLFFDTTLITNDMLDEYFLPYRNQYVRDTLALCMTHFDDTYARSLLKSTRHQTIIFSGSDDRIHPENIIHTYSATIPGAKHIQFRNCGHFVHEEKAGRFNDEALAFLNHAGKAEQNTFHISRVG